MRCNICGRESESEYCVYHSMAYKNVREQFEKWSRALGLTWEEYLRELMKNDYTGVWAKEVADYCLRDVKSTYELFQRAKPFYAK